MLHYAWLFCKRVTLLLPGLILALLATQAVLPGLGRRTDIALSVLVAYVIGAYGVLPAVMRLWQIHLRTEHVPLYAVTPDGFASDPINVGLAGSRRQLIAAMEAIGWHRARRITPRTAFRTIWSYVINHRYDGMPMSSLYLFGRHQDLGFECEATKEGRGHRHHVRFWATTLKDMREATIADTRHPTREEQEIADHMLWAGAASKDIGITFAPGGLQFTHAVSPDTNHERKLLIEQLEKVDKAESIAVVQLTEPYNLPNFAWSRALNTDGKMAVLRLK